MSFRIEEKLFIIPENKFLFFKWLNDSNGKKIYSDRIVSSTYFDNDKLSMFHHSEEGVVPRKKLRLRSYSSKPHVTTDTFLEKKISSPEGRYKISDPTEHVKKYLKYGIFDKNISARKIGDYFDSKSKCFLFLRARTCMQHSDVTRT